MEKKFTLVQKQKEAIKNKMILKSPERIGRLRELQYQVGFRIGESGLGIVDETAENEDGYAADIVNQLSLALLVS